MNNNHLLNIDISSYKILKQGFSFSWSLNKSLPFLDGHFPSRPILPAATILDLCINGLELYLPEGNILLENITNAKYMEIIEPGHELLFTYYSEDKISWSIEITNTKTLNIVSKIKMSLKINNL